jgi:hypothetical protein
MTKALLQKTWKYCDSESLHDGQFCLEDIQGYLFQRRGDTVRNDSHPRTSMLKRGEDS